MKTHNLLSSRIYLLIMTLVTGFLFSTTSYSQDDDDGDAAKDCACIKKIVTDGVITFVNMEWQAQQNPDNVIMLSVCVDGETCGGVCSWKKNEGVHGWKTENGVCMEWPIATQDGTKNYVISEGEIIEVESEMFGFYPNPASESIQIESSSLEVTTIIYTVAGTEVLRTSDKSIDVNELSSGAYIITMTDGIHLQREQLIIQ